MKRVWLSKEAFWLCICDQSCSLRPLQPSGGWSLGLYWSENRCLSWLRDVREMEHLDMPVLGQNDKRGMSRAAVEAKHTQAHLLHFWNNTYTPLNRVYTTLKFARVSYCFTSASCIILQNVLHCWHLWYLGYATNHIISCSNQACDRDQSHCALLASCLSNPISIQVGWLTLCVWISVTDKWIYSGFWNVKKASLLLLMPVEDLKHKVSATTTTKLAIMIYYRGLFVSHTNWMIPPCFGSY